MIFAGEQGNAALIKALTSQAVGVAWLSAPEPHFVEKPD